MNQQFELYNLTRVANSKEDVYSGKSLLERALGKFYTPKFIVNSLIEQLSIDDFEGQTLRIIDPFCGDGRLIVKFLQVFKKEITNKSIEIHIWDIDNEALNVATENIQNHVLENEFLASVIATCQNSFFSLNDNLEGTFDLCLTNPPWEVIKPDRRELEHLSEEKSREYIYELKKLDEVLTDKFPTSQPKIKFAGWGMNLARLGVEVSLRLLKANGKAAIVSPATLFGDKQSTKLREWIFSNYSVDSITSYSAETKLFNKVDQEIVSFVVTKNVLSKGQTRLLHYGKGLELIDFGKLLLKFEQLSENDFCPPNFYGLIGIDILKQIEHQPRLISLSNGSLWTGRELDETRHRKLLNEVKEGIPFIKGRMVGRYLLKEDSTFYVSKENISELPKSINYFRIVWRDVSRYSQKRRMIATIIPPQQVTGNSLNIAYFKADNSLKKLKALLVIMNSLVFELQVRSMLSTSHMSLGTVRMARIPDLNNEELVNSLSGIADKLLKGNDWLEIEAERLVCKAYEIDSKNVEKLIILFENVHK